MFTERQLKLLDKAIRLGYGYSVYAGSVKRQGFCTKKQESALIKMIDTAEYRKNNWGNGYKKGKVSHDLDRDSCISDEEAMDFGEFY